MPNIAELPSVTASAIEPTSDQKNTSDQKKPAAIVEQPTTALNQSGIQESQGIILVITISKLIIMVIKSRFKLLPEDICKFSDAL